jgi:YD repeat-containing protein
VVLHSGDWIVTQGWNALVGVLRKPAANARIRPIKLTDNQATPVDWVKDVAYNAAGQITTMSYARNPSGSSYYTETRQYNILQQLTRLTVPGVMDHEYRFSATQNDGRLTQRKDWVSGEEITYQYDSLNRLISAQTTGPEWGQSFGYDGFGNLLSQTVTKGSAPTLSVTVNPATNRITNAGMSYDANGNLTAMPGLTMTYDTDNRMLSNSSGDSYLYDAAGQRVKKTNGGITALYFYGVDGNLLHNWPSGYNVYFGNKLIYNSTAAVVTDRLGSVVQKDLQRPATSLRRRALDDGTEPPQVRHLLPDAPPPSTTPSNATTPAPSEGSPPRTPTRPPVAPPTPGVGTAMPTSKTIP